MSNFLQKSVKKLNLLSAILAVILAAAIVVGILCGVNGFGVFNKANTLKDSKTLTVSMSKVADLDDVAKHCEAEFKTLGVSYEYKLESDMSGDNREIVYVFSNDYSEDKMTEVESELQKSFANDTDTDWNGSFISVLARSEKVIEVLAEGYVLRGIIAGVVLAVLTLAYVAIRYGWRMGVVAGINTALGMLVTTALFILTRIPVTASVVYVLAVSGLLTAVMTVMSLSKIRENQRATREDYVGAEELVCGSLATKEILTFVVCAGAGIVLMGVVATAGARWFAILSLIALVVAAALSLVFAPAVYLPFQKALDARPVKGAYVGAESTSTKIKKFFEKKVLASKEEVVEEKAEEVEEVEEEITEEVVEETTEEVVEESVEETVAEETVEEEVEETTEEEKTEE